jgi:hypothetical protein
MKAQQPELIGTVVQVMEQHYVWNEKLKFSEGEAHFREIFPLGWKLTRACHYCPSDDFEDLSEEETLIYKMSD